MGVVVGLLIAFALVILLVLLYRSRKVKGKRRAISSSGNHFSDAPDTFNVFSVNKQTVFNLK